MDNFTVMSYNSSGFSSHTINFIQMLLLAHGVHIFAIQEHWLLEQNLFKIDQCFDKFEKFSMPASKTFIKGRASGGIAILFRKSLSPFVKRIYCPNSKRVQGLQVKNGNLSYVFINCYFPTDPQLASADVSEILHCLQDVQYIMDNADKNSKFIMMGDLNSDFSRNSNFVNFVKAFISSNDMHTVWSKFECDYTYSFSKIVNGLQRSFFSRIYHFCLSPDLMTDCIMASPVHSVDNISNHAPIIMSVKCKLDGVVEPETNCSIPSHPLWKKATPENLNSYVSSLEDNLRDIHIPHHAINCTDVHCKIHTADIDCYAANVMDAISQSVGSNIPMSSSSANSRTPMPGFSDFVKPYREDSLFWHAIWVSAGRPQNTQLHLVMKSTRNKYHYAIHPFFL